MTEKQLQAWAEEVWGKTMYIGPSLGSLDKLCRLAREDMREQCAEVADGWLGSGGRCAEAIRNLEV
jgi:hypothetical protein